MSLTLLIGNKNYSSWSLRPWLALRVAGIPFREEVLPLFTDAFRARLAAVGGAGKVPVLLDGDRVVWESLAILEYLAERHPEAHLWPLDADARAVARCVAAEMHAGFATLRTAMPMNCRADYAGRVPMTDALRADIDRVCALWRDCRARFGAGGPFLFGAFCAADAMYAPVVSRFRTYGVAVDATCSGYMDAVFGLPAMADWMAAAAAEPWVVPEDEI